MGLLDGVLRIFGVGRAPADQGLYYYVRCQKCGEKIRFRVDLRWDLAPDYDGDDTASSYKVTKRIVGQRCMRMIDVTLTFDRNRKETGRSVVGGQLISEEEYAAS